MGNMITNYDLTRGLTVDGCPFLFLRGKLKDGQGVVLGHYTLRSPEDFLSFNAHHLMDIVVIIEQPLNDMLQKLIQGLMNAFQITSIRFHHGPMTFREEQAYFLIFEREDCDDIFALSTPYKDKDSTNVFVYNGKTFTHKGNAVETSALQAFCKSGKKAVVAFERSYAQRLEAKYYGFFDNLEIYEDDLKIDNKSYIVAILALPDSQTDDNTDLSDKKSTAAYYGEGTFLEEKRVDHQTQVEPIELRGIQLVSNQAFHEMDGENIYSSVPRVGEFPMDEEGETWFYVNKKADSFVEVYHACSERIYVIKAMDPMFFSKIAMGLNKQESIKLTLLVRELDVLATFLSKFGHKEMSFDMEALPDKSVEVRVEVSTGWIAQAKNFVRNVVKGEDGYGKTKYEKMKQLKQKRRPIRTLANVSTGPDGDKVVIAKTAKGIQRLNLNDTEAWKKKFADSPPGTVHELVFNEKRPDVDAMAEKLKDFGWDYEYEFIDGKHIYNIYQPEQEKPRRDMIIQEPDNDNEKEEQPLFKLNDTVYDASNVFSGG